MPTFRQSIEPDLERHRWLHALDLDPEIEVTDWEAKFIEENYTCKRFSPKQRAVIDRMRERYDVPL